MALSVASAVDRPDGRPVGRHESGRIGRFGEGIAARHLERKGWTVLDRNFRLGRNEIDLIARRGNTVAFVEVKTRTNSRYGNPLEAIGSSKRSGIERVAQGWIQRYGTEHSTYRFDAVAVAWSGGPHGSRALVQHVEAAWGV